MKGCIELPNELILRDRGKGWFLSLNKDEMVMICDKCRKPIQTPFMFCPFFNVGICRKCDMTTGNNACGFHFKGNHEHFNIADLKIEEKK